MPNTPLLMFLVQFWNHIITDTFVTLLLKSGLRFAPASSVIIFSRIFCFGLISYFNPHCKFNCKFRPWRSWAIMLNVADQCTKRHNKNSQPTWFDVFDKNWHTLMSHVPCYMSHDISSSQLLELVTWHLGQCSPTHERYMSHFICHVSGVRYQVSGVTCNKVKKEIWRGLSVEGLVSTGYNLNSVKKMVCWTLFF
jgi:hypothetical protein